MSTEIESSPLRICIDVDDMERAIAFYTTGLGLRRGRRFDEGWVELTAGPVPVDLLRRPAGTPANPRPDAPARAYGRHWTPVHLDLVVDDLEDAGARAERAGAVREDEIRSGVSAVQSC